MSLPSPRELVERFGSPLFVYDAEVVRARWEALRASLPGEVDLYYAVKANPALAVVALLRSLGAGAEIASAGELEAVLRAGFDGSRVLYAGPGKTREEMARAVDAGVRVHAESERQIEQLAAIARERGGPVAAGLRVHVPWSAGEAHTIIGGGEASKFGVEREQALARAGAWARLEGLRLEGLHVFNASNVLDAAELVAGARRTLELAVELRAAGLPLRVVDLGGGLGVPYAEGEAPLDVEALGEGLAELHREFRDEIPGLRLALEPGRFLTAEAGILWARVLDRKSCAGSEILVTDAGIHNLLRPALVGQPHRVRGEEEAPTETLGVFRVAGPLCTSLDDLGEHPLPPQTGPGDLLGVENAGAYGFTEAMPAFLSHPVPAEVLLLDGEAHLIRERRPAASHLEGQEIPEPLRS